MRPSFNWIYGACNVGADEFGIAEGVEEAVMEEFDGGGEVFGGHAAEADLGVEESVGGEDVEVEDEVIAEGVDSGDGGEFSIGEIEAGAEGQERRRGCTER